jgi:hypothetical protein
MIGRFPGCITPVPQPHEPMDRIGIGPHDEEAECSFPPFGALMTPAGRRAWFNGRIQLGMLFLVLASLWRWLIHPGPRLSSSVADAIAGVLYGISIGCMLTGLRLNTLRGVGRGPDSDASAR